ncbi:MAG: hypothetical protein WC655_10095 [Candidatus Hydrogenedentales bacterium]
MQNSEAAASDIGKQTSAGGPLPALQLADGKLGPGELVSFPPVPILKAPSDKAAANLLLNPGFEQDLAPWTADGADTSACKTNSLLAAEGANSLEVTPSEAGSVSVSQAVKLNPRTFYAMSALVFAPGESKVALEAREKTAGAVVSGGETSGSMSAWSLIRLVFITGIHSDEILLGFKCSNAKGNAPILIDQCALYALPSENLLPGGTMEVVPEADRMPEWYVNGRGVSPSAEGYKSKVAVELPALEGVSSSLVGLIPARKEWEGKEFWVSAVIKSVPDGNGAPPAVTFSSRIKGADGTLAEVSTPCPATGDWAEAALRVKMPAQLIGNAEDLPPFWTPRFELPAGSAGTAFVDEVVMLALPEGQFDGGLTSLAP